MRREGSRRREVSKRDYERMERGGIGVIEVKRRESG